VAVKDYPGRGGKRMKLGMFYSKVRTPAEDFRWLREHGFDAVIVGPDAALAAEARGQGLEVWACLGTFAPSSEEQQELCLGLDGQRHVWFGSGCPNEPKIRAKSIAGYRQAAELGGLEGVMMDGVRYASPASGLEAFFTCFCERCEGAARRLGFDWPRMRRDVGTLCERFRAGQLPFAPAIASSPAATIGRLAHLPGVVDWLAFRARVIEEFVGLVADEVHGLGKKLGGYVFSPSLAPLVGQDYVALAQHFDLFSPMLYRNTRELNSIAPVNTEIHVVVSWAKEQPKEALAWALQFFGLAEEKLAGPEELLSRGLSAEAMALETARARALIGERGLVPILWHDDSTLRRTLAAIRRGGADGASIFIFNEPLKRRLARGL
jgi:hypothetical protein